MQPGIVYAIQVDKHRGIENPSEIMIFSVDNPNIRLDNRQLSERARCMLNPLALSPPKIQLSRNAKRTRVYLHLRLHPLLRPLHRSQYLHLYRCVWIRSKARRSLMSKLGLLLVMSSKALQVLMMLSSLLLVPMIYDQCTLLRGWNIKRIAGESRCRYCELNSSGTRYKIKLCFSLLHPLPPMPPFSSPLPPCQETAKRICMKLGINATMLRSYGSRTQSICDTPYFHTIHVHHERSHAIVYVLSK